MLQTALRAISVIIVGVSALLAGVLVAEASDNEGEQSELSEIREQECTNNESDAWGASSPQQLQNDGCQQ